MHVAGVTAASVNEDAFGQKYLLVDDAVFVRVDRIERVLQLPSRATRVCKGGVGIEASNCKPKRQM